MVLFCSFMLTKMGMEPKMSMMAAMTMKAPKISTKLMLLNMVSIIEYYSTNNENAVQSA